MISGVASLMLCGGAFAGKVYDTDVYVGSFLAYGAMGEARFDGSKQFIGCHMHGLGSPSIFCSAKNEAGKYGSCYGSSWGYREAVKSMAAFSYVYFIWAPNGECLYVGVSTDSRYIPDLDLD